jgi:glycosyltransferase involved in cell wall biosynthesis
MHIFYIHQHFALPSGSTGTRSYEFARRWVQAGHKVTVVTGHYDIGGLQVGQGLIQRQTIEGINVVIVGTRYSNKQSFFQRVFSFLAFTVLSIFVGLKEQNIDVVYATSTPLTVGIPAMVIKACRFIPFVFEVRDQWPRIPIELGIIKNRWLIQCLHWLEKTIYQHASAIVALSPGMADGVRNTLKCDKPISIIPNSSDTQLFRPDIDGTSVRNRYKWEDKFVFLHFGAMGKANGLDFIIQVAERLKENRDIHFVIVGDGSEKSRLKSLALSLELKNIEFTGSIPKSELPSLVASCDVSMVIFANFPILEENSANKFFDSLSAGKPILLNYSGWQKEILEKNKAGFGCHLCNIDEFIRKVVYLHSHRELLVKMKKNSRKIAENIFNRDVLSGKVLQALKSTQNNSSRLVDYEKK